VRKQQQIWLDEHTKQTTLPTMAHVDPTSGVVFFADFLKSEDIRSGRVVDIGAGKGRNSVYLAEQGFEVYGLEYIKEAIGVAKTLAKSRDVSNKVHFQLCEMDKPWEFDDEFFDIAVDSFSSIDIETKDGREMCRDEMYRTLKAGGFALVTVVSADDEWEREMIDNHPGPEPNSCIWPQNEKFQKDYDEAELCEFYKMFELVELKKVSKPATKLGREGIATNLWTVLRKPDRLTESTNFRN
jgi:SAM-dependent methyltransferase